MHDMILCQIFWLYLNGCSVNQVNKTGKRTASLKKQNIYSMYMIPEKISVGSLISKLNKKQFALQTV